jgi:copper chaperone
MNKATIQIENLKCHGCASTIRKGLLKFEEVKSVGVDIEKSLVEISFDGENEKIMDYKTKLARLGYPKTGNNNSISVAKSFISCAIGRVNK